MPAFKFRRFEATELNPSIFSRFGPNGVIKFKITKRYVRLGYLDTLEQTDDLSTDWEDCVKV